MTALLRRDWVSKTLAGVVLGATFALGCSGVFAQLATGIPLPIRAQLTMWLVAPIWLVVMSSVFFFTSGKRAWFVLAATNLLVFTVFHALRMR